MRSLCDSFSRDACECSLDETLRVNSQSLFEEKKLSRFSFDWRESIQNEQTTLRVANQTCVID